MNPAHLHPLAAALAATAFTFTLAGAAKKSVRFQEIVLTEQDLGDDIITAQNSPGWGLAWFEQTKAADGGITFAARHIKRHMKGAARRGEAIRFRVLAAARAHAGRPKRRCRA